MTELTRQILALDEAIGQRMEAAETAARSIRRRADEEAEALTAQTQRRFETDEADGKRDLEAELASARSEEQQALHARKTAFRSTVDPGEIAEALLQKERRRVCP